MAARGIIPINSTGLRVALVIALLLLTASCASFDCAWDTKGLPDPIAIHAEDGALWGQNYTACFVMNGVIYKEYIPECAYRYYYSRQVRQDFLR